MAGMSAACCRLLVLSAASYDARRMDDRRLVASFGLDDKISLVLDDVIHAVPRTQTAAVTANGHASPLTEIW